MTENSKLYKIYKGDSAELLKEIETGSVDAIVTDPPYLYLKHKLDVPFDEDLIFSEWHRVLQDDGMLVIFGRGVSLARWIVKLDELGFRFLEEIVWGKSKSGSSFNSIQRKHELVMVFTKGKGKINKIRIDPLTVPSEQLKWDKLFKNLNTLKNSIKDPYTLKVINHYIESGEATYDTFTKQGSGITGHRPSYGSINRPLGNFITTVEGYVVSTIIEVGHVKNKYHPTQKPDSLMEILVRLVTDEGDTVLDSFMGSGTTGVASLNLGRQFIGIELDDEYFSTAQQRLEEASSNPLKDS